MNLTNKNEKNVVGKTACTDFLIIYGTLGVCNCMDRQKYSIVLPRFPPRIGQFAKILALMCLLLKLNLG
jgi:hypothetical protein